MGQEGGPFAAGRRHTIPSRRWCNILLLHISAATVYQQHTTAACLASHAASCLCLSAGCGPGVNSQAAAVPGVFAAHRAAAASVAGTDRGRVVEHIAAAGAAPGLIAPAQALQRLKLCLQRGFLSDNCRLLPLNAFGAAHYFLLAVSHHSLSWPPISPKQEAEVHSQMTATTQLYVPSAQAALAGPCQTSTGWEGLRADLDKRSAAALQAVPAGQRADQLGCCGGRLGRAHGEGPRQRLLPAIHTHCDGPLWP